MCFGFCWSNQTILRRHSYVPPYKCSTSAAQQMSPFKLYQMLLNNKPFPAQLLYSGSVLEKALFPSSLTNTCCSSSLVQLERCWATCSRCPVSDERTTSSTRGSLSTRISCSATTCRPRLHLEDIRPLQLSSSWPQGWTRCSHVVRMRYYLSVSMKNFNGRSAVINVCYYFHFQRSMVWILSNLCRTPTLTSLGPVVLSPVSRQEPPSSPWQPTTSCLTVSKQTDNGLCT